MTTIETPRLILRQPTAKDGTLVTGFLNDEPTARMLARVPFPYHLDDWRKFFAQVVSGGREQVFAITLKGRDSVTGLVSMIPEDDGPDTFHIGFWVGKPFRRRGIAKEAAAGIIARGFENPQMQAATSGYFVDNVASEALHKKLKFERVGTGQRMSLARGDEPVGHVDVRLSRERWMGG